MKNEFVVYQTIYLGDLLPKYYIGSTSRSKVESGKYFGTVSSIRYKKIFKEELKNNRELFSIEILSYHETRKEALEEELRVQKENDVVRSSSFFNESYASIDGCFGRNVCGKNNPMFNRTNEVIAVNENGDKIRVSKDEFDHNDNLSGHTCGMLSVVDLKTNKLVRIRRDEYDKTNYRHHCVGMKSSEKTKNVLSSQRKGSLIVRDWDGNKFRVDADDDRIKSGVLSSHRALRYLITDPNGNEFKTINIKLFFNSYGIIFYKEFKQINGDVIVNHNPRNSNSLNRWRILCLDSKRKYKQNKL